MSKMNDFLTFLLLKVFKSKPISIEIVTKALEATYKDVLYHFPDLSYGEIEDRIQSNNSELAIFLFRLGNELHVNGLDELKFQIHWLLKELCSCEVYFNNQIGEGFYIVHGQGIVIGSRNIIGNGFKIHQGATIGHKKNGTGAGNVIGNDVTIYCNSSVLGELMIGDNVIIGAHVMITKNIDSNRIITSSTENKLKVLPK